MLGCSACGRSLIAGRCLSCEARRWSHFVHRELVLVAVLAGVAVGGFFATRAVAHSNEALRRRQAAEWFDMARQSSRDGNIETAVLGLRRAVLKDPDNRAYRLALADALAATRLDDEATRVLLVLREAQPEDPQTNLRLARLEARGPDTDATRRYYQNALAALWRPEQTDERQYVRTELIEYLLAREERPRALSELLLLAANLPQDPDVQAQVGRMFLAAGDPRLALNHFAAALRLNPKDGDALAGAGEAAFELADYNRALRYLNAAPREDTRVAELREVARLVLNGDPLAPRLGPQERRRRLSAAVEQAVQRLDACLSNPPPQANAGLEALRSEARALRAALDLPPRREPRDLVDDGIELVYRVERAVHDRCRTSPGPFDRALLLIGRRHAFEEQ
jgi:tetratricopeptide (TPR) repeat protein